MKIKTTDAARTLAIHPSQLLLQVAQLDPALTFSDVWPEIDDSWVETIGATRRYRGSPRTSGRVAPHPTKPSAETPNLSENAIHVLDKLSRQRKWGSVSVAFDSLFNLTHVPGRELEDALDELRKQDLLYHDGRGRGTISLSPAKRKDIERLTQQSGRG